MSEVLFLGLVTAAVVLAARTRPRAAALAGLCLALATVTRPVGIVAVPVVVAAYALRRHWRAAVLASLAFALPVLLYAGVHYRYTEQFALTDMDGWYLYGRIGEIVGCSAADRAGPDARLCRQLPGVHDPAVWIFLPQSPAWDLLGPPGQPDPVRRSLSSTRLRAFAVHTIEEHPGDYTRLVLRDLGQLVLSDDLPQQLPASAAAVPDKPTIHRRYMPGYRPVVRPPAAWLRTYERWVHVPQWGYLAGVVVVGVGLLCRRVSGRRTAATAAVVGVALVVFAATTARADPRYSLPSLPLLVLATALVTGPAGLGYRAHHRTPRACRPRPLTSGRAHGHPG